MIVIHPDESATYILSTKRMTIRVVVDQDNQIVSVAPIAKRFLYQSLSKLEGWLRKQGGFWKVKLN